MTESELDAMVMLIFLTAIMILATAATEPRDDSLTCLVLGDGDGDGDDQT